MVDEYLLAIGDLQEVLIQQHIVIASGIKFIMYVLGAFFVWVVLKACYALFANIFFGGV